MFTLIFNLLLKGSLSWMSRKPLKCRQAWTSLKRFTRKTLLKIVTVTFFKQFNDRCHWAVARNQQPNTNANKEEHWMWSWDAGIEDNPSQRRDGETGRNTLGRSRALRAQDEEGQDEAHSRHILTGGYINTPPKKADLLRFLVSGASRGTSGWLCLSRLQMHK